MSLSLRIVIQRSSSDFLILMIALALFMLMGCGTAAKKSAHVLPDGTEEVTSKSMALSAKYIDASKEKILGNFDQAVKLLEECIKTDPKHHPSYYQLADINHIRREYDDALFWIEKAIALDKSNVWYRVLHADLLLKLGRYREAASVYDAINSMRPGKRLWYEAKAHANLRSGKLKDAAATYRDILDRFDFDEDIFFRLLDVYEKQGNHRKVEQSLHWLIQQYSYETRYLGLMAAYYNERNQPAKALPLWQEILRIEPGNGEVRFELANYYRSRGEEEQAFSELHEAFKTPNLSIDAKIVVMLSYYDLTQKYPELLPEAYTLLGIMVEQHHENPKGWSMYGDFLFRDERYAEALKMMQTVVQLDSSRYLVWEQLLESAYRISNFSALVSYGEKSLRMFPDQALLYLYHGSGLFHAGRYDDAIRVFNQGYFFTGFNDSLAALFLMRIAEANHEKAEAGRAEDYYKRALGRGLSTPEFVAAYLRFMAMNSSYSDIPALESAIQRIQPDDPLLKIAKLWKMLGTGRNTDIKAELEKITGGNSENYKVLEHAGFLCYHAGMTDEALVYWRRAAGLSVGNVILQKRIENIEI